MARRKTIMGRTTIAGTPVDGAADGYVTGSADGAESALQGTDRTGMEDPYAGYGGEPTETVSMELVELVAAEPEEREPDPENPGQELFFRRIPERGNRRLGLTIDTRVDPWEITDVFWAVEEE